MSTLVIIPCGQKKIWDKHLYLHRPVRAWCAYTGGSFKLNWKYATTFGDRWVILSAKYGYIPPGFKILENYNVSFKKKSSNPISVEELAKQIREQKLADFDRIIGLGGKEYREAMRISFKEFNKIVEFPFAGLTIGRHMSAVKKALQEKGGYW